MREDTVRALSGVECGRVLVLKKFEASRSEGSRLRRRLHHVLPTHSLSSLKWRRWGNLRCQVQSVRGGGSEMWGNFRCKEWEEGDLGDDYHAQKRESVPDCIQPLMQRHVTSRVASHTTEYRVLVCNFECIRFGATVCAGTWECQEKLEYVMHAESERMRGGGRERFSRSLHAWNGGGGEERISPSFFKGTALSQQFSLPFFWCINVGCVYVVLHNRACTKT
jgi:hypothetical protein